MSLDEFSFIAVILVIFTSAILSISRDWRLSISALGAQYVGVFLFTALTWPLEMAAVKLVAGWISAAVLGMELVGASKPVWGSEERLLSRIFFRLIFIGMVALVMFSIAPEMAKWMLSASYEQILGGLMLIGMGLLHLGISAQPFRAILGLLTVISGFEIIYCTVETSPVVAGMLAVINLGVALLGAYFLIAPSQEVAE